MMGLLADGWFYISSAGLLVSGVLFFFLLGQYRAASEAADAATESEQGADKESVASVRPVYIPDDAPDARIVSHPSPEPRPDPASATGGLSPAVGYLQNIKAELAELHQEVRSLAKRIDSELASVSTRDAALLARLGELARAIDDIKVPAATVETRVLEPVAEPAVVVAESAAFVAELVVPVSEPVASVPEPVVSIPEPKAEAARSPDETIRMELGAFIAAPPAEPEPDVPAAEPTAQLQAPVEQAPVLLEPPPEEKPRRGPVWPV